MVTSSYEWSILKWDEKPQSNNQTNKPGFAHLYFLYFHIKMILCTFSASILYQYMYIGVCWKDKKGPFVRLTLLSTITTTDGSGQLFTRILFFSSKLHFLINLKWTNAYAHKTNMIQVVDVTLNRGEIPKFAVREYIRYICDCQWRFGKFRLTVRVSCLWPTCINFKLG